MNDEHRAHAVPQAPLRVVATHARRRPAFGTPTRTSGLIQPTMAVDWSATRQRGGAIKHRGADQVGGGRCGPPLAARPSPGPL